MGSNPLEFIRNTNEGDDGLKEKISAITESKHGKQKNMGKQKHIHENEPEVYLTKQEPRNGLAENWTRATYIMQNAIVEKIRAVAYWERKQVKEVVEEAFLKYLDGKRIEAVPKKHSRTVIS